ncbi:MAG: hypothetical protein V4772_08505 [Pseudomonadota bacterium]
MTDKAQTNAMLRRKVERLEAQLKAAQDFMQRDRKGEFQMIMENADMRVKIKQAADLLLGRDV